MAEMMNPALEGATLMFPQGSFITAYAYTGVEDEIKAYQTSAWIGTALMTSPIYDVYGPDAVKLMGQVCTNDFTTLGMNGIRHAVMCNEKGQILTDGVVIRIGEDRYRTYWLDPVISYYVNTSDLDVHGENMSGKEYFIQIDGEKSLEILENAFQANLHDIKFGRHRIQEVNGKQVRIIRLGMSGNLAYEIHGDMADYAEIYNLVWAAGEKLGARKLGLQAYNMFNHTEAGFPNINLHYPLPWLETSEKMTEYMRTVPQLSMFNLNRRLLGSVGDDLQARFVTPYDVGWDFLIKYNHDFIGKEALLEMSKKPQKKCVTLEWNAKDVAEVFATMLSPGEEPCEDITKPCALEYYFCVREFGFEYRADKVLAADKEIGITSGKIISYTYNSMISLAFISAEYAKEGTELEILWGTPGTRQMKVRAKVARFPYNQDYIRNEKRDVSGIPVFER